MNYKELLKILQKNPNEIFGDAQSEYSGEIDHLIRFKFPA